MNVDGISPLATINARGHGNEDIVAAQQQQQQLVIDATIAKSSSCSAGVARAGASNTNGNANCVSRSTCSENLDKEKCRNV